MKFSNLNFTGKAITVMLSSIFIFSATAQNNITSLPQQPGIYRVKIGEANVVALSDGTIPLNLNSLLHNYKPGEINTILKSNFLDTIVETSITSFLIKLDNQLILIDAGSGSFMGPTLGKVKANLLAAGYQPEDITAVLLTHLHADHVGGLIDNGKMVFPNATIYVSKPEAAFWLTKGNKEKANKRAQPSSILHRLL